MSPSFLTRRGPQILLIAVGAAALLPVLLFAQPSTPLETTATKMKDWITGPIADAFSIFAIAFGGYVMMFGDGSAKRMLAGIIAGITLAIGASRWFTAFFSR